MAFKSRSQRRKFYAMAGRGEMPMSTVKEWESKTHGKLPERVKRKKKSERITRGIGTYAR